MGQRPPLGLMSLADESPPGGHPPSPLPLSLSITQVKNKMSKRVCECESGGKRSGKMISCDVSHHGHHHHHHHLTHCCYWCLCGSSLSVSLHAALRHVVSAGHPSAEGDRRLRILQDSLLVYLSQNQSHPLQMLFQ